MPISPKHPIRRLSQDEFGDIAYEVMRHAFEVHRDLGRLFSEEIYQVEIAHRLGNAICEVPVDISFGDFRTTLFLDLLVDGGAIFEFKAVEALVARHRAQLLNYLLLTDAAHGKIVNMRPEDVEHEFVNTNLRRQDRISFSVETEEWKEKGLLHFLDWFVALVRDWGVGLDLSLYEEAIKHRFDPGKLLTTPEIRGPDGRIIGSQDILQISPATAVRITAVPVESLPAFEHHLCRFFRHSSLDSLHWINLTRPAVQFKTIN
jgi:GxxExxY protein